MKQVGELLKTEEVEIEFEEDGEKKVEKYLISRIPAIPAESILLMATEAFQERNFSMLPRTVTMELMKYVAHNNIVLDSEVMINAHIPSVDILIALQVKMAEKNFSFLGQERFQKQLEALRKLLG